MITMLGARDARTGLVLGGQAAKALSTCSLATDQALSVLTGDGGGFVFFGFSASATPLVVAGEGMNSACGSGAVRSDR